MRSTHTPWRYLIVFVIALALRLTLLGEPPLNDQEAVWALQAHRLAAGKAPLVGAQTAYVNLTAALFFVFESSDFLARFVPALAGAALTWLPYAFRRRLKPIPGLLLSIFLALDPGLVALSRQAGSPILALTFALFAWACWDNYRPRLAGLFAGLALLSGPALWPGLLGLGLAWVMQRAWMPSNPARPKTTPSLVGWRSALVCAGGVMFFVGSLFLLSPSGLTAWLSGLPDYLRGWWTSSDVPAWRLLLALVAYQPPALLLALIALLRGWQQGNKRPRRLSLWLLSALLLALLYPSRQVSDLEWTLIPLWGLAALEMARHLRVPRENRLEVWGVAVLITVVLGFAWLNMLSLARLTWPSPEATARLWLFFGALLLIAISLILVGLGWSFTAAKYGGLYGLLIILGIYTLGAAWGATGLRTPHGMELWDAVQRPVQARLLAQTVGETSEWSAGDAHTQQVTIVGIDSPAMQWLLRRNPLETTTLLDPTASPPMLITSSLAELNLPAVYRGQDFAWKRSIWWNDMDVFAWLRWLTMRTMPEQTEDVILWVRDDLFVDRSQ